MNLILVASILIRLLAVVLSLVFLRKTRDWRVAVFPLLFTLMAMQQIFRAQAIPSELPGLTVSLLVIFAMLLTYRLLSQNEQAKKALEESHERFHRLMESNIIGILIADFNGKISDANEAFLKMVGYNREELLSGRIRWDEMTPPEYRSLDEQAIEELKRDGASSTWEKEFIRKDGSRVPILIGVALLEDIECIAFVLDITEHKRAENALRESNEFNKQIIASVQEGINVFDREMRYLVWNPFSERLTGFRAEAVLGKQFSEVFPQLADTPVYTSIERALAGESSAMSDIQGVSPITGQPLWLAVKYGPLYNASSEIIGVIVTINDLTERKQADEALRQNEANFRYLFANNPLPMWVVDLESLHFMEVNDAAVNHYGYTREEFLRMHMAEIRLPEDVPRMLAFMQNVQRFNVAPIVRHRCKDGRLIFVEVSAHRFAFKGRPAVLTVAIDITERKRAEEQLKESHEELRALSAHLESVREEERARIAREIHDELGSALTGLKMDVSWLDRRLAQDANKQQAALLEKTRQMNTLIESTVQVTRKLVSELRPGILDDLGIIAAIEWQLNDFQNRTGIACELLTKASFIDLERDRSTAVFRILQEALTNVARHASATRIEVRLEQENSNLLMEVEDNGQGLQTLDLGKSKSFGIVGMRERVMLLNGEFHIGSASVNGTAVRIRIPLR